mmetsp:Transcript_84868/g.248762  ORF Transcript_84868/g.248762 Transcript_84868/m.248762 type:complete len:263 (-) Transcript_84868:1632-2420(-)
MEIGNNIGCLPTGGLEEHLEEASRVRQYPLQCPVAVPMNPEGEHGRHPLNLHPTSLLQLLVGSGHVGALRSALLVAGAVHGPDARHAAEAPRESRHVVVLARDLRVVAGYGHHRCWQLRHELCQAQDAVASTGVAHKVNARRVHRKLGADARNEADDKLLHLRAPPCPREVPALILRPDASLEPVQVALLRAIGQRCGSQRAEGRHADEATTWAELPPLEGGALRSLLQQAAQLPCGGVHALVGGRSAVQIHQQREGGSVRR